VKTCVFDEMLFSMPEVVENYMLSLIADVLRMILHYGRIEPTVQ